MRNTLIGVALLATLGVWWFHPSHQHAFHYRQAQAQNGPSVPSFAGDAMVGRAGQAANAFADCYQRHIQRACDSLDEMQPQIEQDSRTLAHLSGRQSVQNGADDIRQRATNSQRRMEDNNAYWNAKQTQHYWDSQADAARAAGNQGAAYGYQQRARHAAEEAEGW